MDKLITLEEAIKSISEYSKVINVFTPSVKDLLKLLECVPKPKDTITIECLQWYKDCMEKKYGKAKRVRGD